MNFQFMASINKVAWACCIFILSLFSQNDIAAQEPFVLERLKGEIVFDGLSNEAAWQNIEPLPIIMFQPEYGAEPSEFTELKVAYDDDYLYFSGVMHDSHPDKWKIQLRRDDWKYNCDWLALILDTFNDNENTVTFWTSPSGGRTDVAFSNDVNSLETDINASWNTFWDVKTVTDEKGWYAEMRIPFSSLRFQEVDGEVVIGISAFRYISNLYEYYVFPKAAKKHGFWGLFKASQTQEFVIKGIKSKKPLYIAPYVLGGLEQTNQLNDAGNMYQRTDIYKWNAGLDIKYRLSDNLTMDVSLNTDFAQVEADDQQVNLTRFSLFFPEKRLFFQERRSNFEFNFDQSNRLFYTRRIGIDNGSPVGIYGGGRIVGRVGPWDLGLLSMQAAPTENLFSENFSVMRFRRQVINKSTYVGGIFTNRMDLNGNFNSAYGIDGIFHLFGDDYLKLMWAQSFQDENLNDVISLDPSRVFLNWQRRTDKGIGYNLSFSRAGKDYNPGMGYERRKNYAQYGLKIFHGWIPAKKILYSHKVELNSFQFIRNSDGSRESAELWIGWLLSSQNNSSIKITQKAIYDNLAADFYLSEDEYVPSGSYTFTNFNAEFQSARGKAFSLASVINVGPFYDGWINSVSLSPRGTINNRVEFIGTYQFNKVKFADRDMQYVSHIFRLNSILVFNTQLSFAAFVQYNSAIDAVLANARLRYNPKEGTDLYIVYNEGYNTERYRGIPALPISNARTIMLKYTYTFIL